MSWLWVAGAAIIGVIVGVAVMYIALAIGMRGGWR